MKHLIKIYINDCRAKKSKHYISSIGNRYRTVSSTFRKMISIFLLMHLPFGYDFAVVQEVLIQFNIQPFSRLPKLVNVKDERKLFVLKKLQRKLSQGLEEWQERYFVDVRVLIYLITENNLLNYFKLIFTTQSLNQPTFTLFLNWFRYHLILNNLGTP